MNSMRFVCIFLALFTQNALARPGDSVTSGANRRFGSAIIGAPEVERRVVVNGVPLGTYSYLSPLRLYGPYKNESGGKISLNIDASYLASSARKVIVGYVDDRVVDKSADAVNFEIFPGEKYSFIAPVNARLTVFAYSAYQANMGLPSAEVFLRPTGNFRKCIYRNLGAGEISAAVFLYEEGTLTDRSQSLEGWPEEGYTEGPAPPVHGECVTYDIF